MFKTELGELIAPREVSTVEKPGQRMVVVAVEKVPQLIEEIVVNPLAKKLLPPEYRYLAEADYWREHVCLSVPHESKQPMIKSPRYFGRAVPLGRGQIPYGNFVGGLVFGKGLYRSGMYYDNYQVESNRMTPIGLFGHTDAVKETRLGNGLLEAGYRSALCLATVVYKTDSMRRFLLDRWRNKGVGEDIERGFGILEKHGDKPVFLGRLTGVMWRRGENHFDGEHWTGQMSWAAQLWLSEARLFRPHFEKYLLSTGLSFGQCIRVLEKLACHRKLSEQELAQFADFSLGMSQVNAWALAGGVDNNPVFNRYYNMASVLAAPKDNCLAGFSLDYEEATEKFTTETFKISEQYMDFARNYNRQWTQGFVRRGFTKLT